MAEDYLSLDAQEQGDILRTVAVRSGRPAVILEKDIWVCWALQTVFSVPDHHPMAFKGGTSLAKVYGIIDRFSEDVDITLDYRAFEDDFDPFDPAVSKTGIRRFSDRLKGHVQRYTREVNDARSQRCGRSSRDRRPARNPHRRRMVRPSGLRIHRRSRSRSPMSRAKSCWSSAAATSLIRTSSTTSFPTSPN